MTTIKVLVKNKKDAGLLIRMLRRMSFVEHVEELSIENAGSGQFETLKKYLDSNSNPNYFKQINNPVKWQKNIRDEWQ